MSMLFAEPDSPVMYEDEPELDGLRHLSVSSDGTIDSLVSQDENPTPPQSPHPVVHISSPGAPFSRAAAPRVLEFGDDYRMSHIMQDKLPSGRSTPLALATPTALPVLPFFADATAPPSAPPHLHLESPVKPSANDGPIGTLAARRAASGKLPNKALLSLQQMRFESSGDAGMGLGVGPGSAGFEGMEGVSPSTSGMTFRLAMGLDNKSGTKSKSSSPLPSPGIENIALDLSFPLLSSPAQLRRSASTSSRKMSLSPGGSPSLSASDDFKLSLRGSQAFNDKHNHALHSPQLSLPPRNAPPSPLILRSSAFTYNTGPLTPLTPSHIPGAPSLGAGGASFDWFAYSTPDSPGCPVPPQGAHPALQTCYFSDPAGSSPAGPQHYLPTPGSENGSHRSSAYGLRHQPLPASPLGQGRFANSATNPFFAEA
ncbi:hypothetical protein JCM1840_005706 [Sporobolomyces johnsonii]